MNQLIKIGNNGITIVKAQQFNISGYTYESDMLDFIFNPPLISKRTRQTINISTFQCKFGMGYNRAKYLLEYLQSKNVLFRHEIFGHFYVNPEFITYIN